MKWTAAGADVCAYRLQPGSMSRDWMRMARSHADATRAALSAESLRRGRNSSAVEWLAPASSRADNTAKEAPPQPLARPFAHPYFWAGFVYTGH